METTLDKIKNIAQTAGSDNPILTDEPLDSITQKIIGLVLIILISILLIF